MKKFYTDSTSNLSRFAKDRRLRRETTSTVSDEQRPSRGQRHTARRSYNPNFDEENRLNAEFRPKQGGRSRRPAAAHNEATDNREGRPTAAPFKKTKGSERNAAFAPKGNRPQRNTARPHKEHSAEQPKREYPRYAPKRIATELRLNRYVAQSGTCSRREADEFIKAGLVSVNGVIVTELGTKVKLSDEVRFNDERIQGEKLVYLLLNKPKGYVTTTEDDHAAKTVMELVAGACTERIYPVGRLDKNSLGLLLFTNDGDIARQLTHPSLNKKKIYEVQLDKPLTRADFTQLAEGIILEDGEAYCDEISYISEDKKSVGVEIHSGRNRIVRRMFEHLGYSVTKLDRVYYAGLTKKSLKRGAWRFLTRDEVNRLKSGRYE